MMEDIKIGDRITIAGYHVRIPNPARRWWTFWRPRYVPSDQIQTWWVTGKLP